MLLKRKRLINYLFRKTEKLLARNYRTFDKLQIYADEYKSVQIIMLIVHYVACTWNENRIVSSVISMQWTFDSRYKQWVRPYEIYAPR